MNVCFRSRQSGLWPPTNEQASFSSRFSPHRLTPPLRSPHATAESDVRERSKCESERKNALTLVKDARFRLDSDKRKKLESVFVSGLSLDPRPHFFSSSLLLLFNIIQKKLNSVEQDKAFELALAEFWSCPDRDASVAAKLGAHAGGIAEVRSRLALLEVRRRVGRERRKREIVFFSFSFFTFSFFSARAHTLLSLFFSFLRF